MSFTVWRIPTTKASMISTLKNCLSSHYGDLNGENPFSPKDHGGQSLERDFFEAVRNAVRKPAPSMEGEQNKKGILEKLDIDILKDASGQAHLYGMSGGTPVGVTLAEKEYELKDSYIQDAPLRKNVSEKMESASAQAKVTWKEKAGVLHLGGQISSFIPLAPIPGGSTGATVGVSADLIVRYRSLSPQLKGQEEQTPVPYTPDFASKMPAGSEFEFLGSFAAGISAGVFVSKGIVAGPAMVGAAAFSSLGGTGKAELGVCVTALDKPGCVRVTVRALRKAESFYAMGITAGLMYQVASNWTTAIGTNATFLPNTATTSAFLNSITQMSVASLGGAIGSNYNDTKLFCVDLDLNQPKALEIYKYMMSFQFGEAANESDKHPECARFAVAKENVSGSSAQAALKMLGEVLIEETQTHQHITGGISLPGGDEFAYIDCSVGEVQKFWLWGNRVVKWQQVLLENKDNGLKRPYFHFTYSDLDKHFTIKRLHTFLGFAESIGLEREKFIKGKEPRLAAIEGSLKRAARVEIGLEVFFTQEGIKKILTSSPEEIQRAYLNASAIIRSEYSESPLLKTSDKAKEARKLIQLFDECVSKLRFDIFALSSQSRRCHKQYKALTGRSLTLDYGLLKQAENFSELVLRANPSDSIEKRSEELFISLGKNRRFRYQQPIAALINLAGKEYARIQKLTLESKYVKLEAEKQDKPDHPQKIFADHVVSVAAL